MVVGFNWTMVEELREEEGKGAKVRLAIARVINSTI